MSTYSDLAKAYKARGGVRVFEVSLGKIVSTYATGMVGFVLSYFLSSVTALKGVSDFSGVIVAEYYKGVVAFGAEGNSEVEVDGNGWFKNGIFWQGSTKDYADITKKALEGAGMLSILQPTTAP
jgi:hypothetical protein